MKKNVTVTLNKKKRFILTKDIIKKLESIELSAGKQIDDLIEELKNTIKKEIK